MSSQRRKTASRANGALSRGPVTPEGKERSSMNALSHGLLAKAVVLRTESEEGFQALVRQHFSHFGPLDGVEAGIIEELVAAQWRARRAWVVENQWLDRLLDSKGSEEGRACIADAYDGLSDTNKLALIQRYETRLHRMYRQSINTLIMLRESKKLRNEPSPTNGHKSRRPMSRPRYSKD